MILQKACTVSSVYRTLGQAVCDHKHPPVRAQVQGDWAAISGELKVQRNSGGSLLLCKSLTFSFECFWQMWASHCVPENPCIEYRAIQAAFATEAGLVREA